MFPSINVHLAVALNLFSLSFCYAYGQHFRSKWCVLMKVGTNTSIKRIDVSSPVGQSQVSNLCSYYGNPVYAEFESSQHRKADEMLEECAVYATIPGVKDRGTPYAELTKGGKEISYTEEYISGHKVKPYQVYFSSSQLY